MIYINNPAQMGDKNDFKYVIICHNSKTLASILSPDVNQLVETCCDH
jgi:hypothetical protein